MIFVSIHILNTVEMTTKDLEYYIINSVDKAVVGFETVDSNGEGSSVGIILSNSIVHFREIFHERKSLKPVIPALWVAEASRSRGQGQVFKTSLANMVKPGLY